MNGNKQKNNNGCEVDGREWIWYNNRNKGKKKQLIN